MAKVVYNGPSLDVEVLSSEGIVVFERGVAKDVDEATAKGLCEQEQWTAVDRADAPSDKGKGGK